MRSVDRTVCVSPDYLRRHGPIEKPEDLAKHECVIYSYHAMPAAWRMKGPDREVIVEVTGSMVSNHGAMLVEAACQGLGFLFLPIFITAASLRNGRLVRVLPERASFSKRPPYGEAAAAVSCTASPRRAVIWP